MASKVSKEKEDYLVLSSVVEMELVDSFLVLVLASTSQREEHCLLLVHSVQ